MFFAEETSLRTIRNNVAVFSAPDEHEVRPLYRHFIGRTWDWKKPRLFVAMCNPSDAGADVEDPTTQRVNQFARRWGYGGWGGVNLADLISPDPKALDTHPHPVSDQNCAYIEYALYQSRKAVTPLLAAWGNNGSRAGRDRNFIAKAKHLGVELICLGLTHQGHPKHPLSRGVHRVADDFEPIPFEPPWLGTVTIGAETVQLHPDGRPVCSRCNGVGRITLEDQCHRCTGSGTHPNPFGDPPQ